MRSWSTLVQVIACCLVAQVYDLNQWWLVVNWKPINTIHLHCKWKYYGITRYYVWNDFCNINVLPKLPMASIQMPIRRRFGQVTHMIPMCWPYCQDIISAPITLTTQDKWIHGFQLEGVQPLVPSRFWEIIENANIFLMFPEKHLLQQGLS